MKGLVIRNTGSWYLVLCADGKTYNCKIKGNFRLKGIRTTNPVAVGDYVELQLNADDTAYIVKIYERTNYIIRRASNLSKESHILASNLDQAFLIVTLKSPETNLTFIDRFIATGEAYGVKVVLVINKVDLLVEDADKEYLEGVKNLYEQIGYKVVGLSAISDDLGFEELKALAQGKVTLMAGNSGVGKSTIINKFMPELDLKVGKISDTHHTGMHTTTFSEMFGLPEGGYLIDTPGVKGFGTIDFDASEVAHYFKEIFELSHDCRYNNCSHTHEPGCAVIAGVEKHYISESRYNSYLNILEDKEEGKYRKAY